MANYIIPNLQKACQTLELLAKRHDGLTLAQVSRELQIPRTSALRILSTLSEEGLVRKNNSVFTLGPKLIHMGLRALERLDIRSMAVPVLRDLVERTGETTHLAILSDNRSLILEVCDSPNPIRVASRAGTLALLHCSATGKVLMSYALGDRFEEILGAEPLEQRTSKTMTQLTALRQEAEEIRRRGYALDNEEYFEGVRCLAVPVRNWQGEVVAAIGITASTVRFPMKRVPEIAAHVQGAAKELSRSLGMPAAMAKSA